MNLAQRTPSRVAKAPSPQRDKQLCGMHSKSCKEMTIDIYIYIHISVLQRCMYICLYLNVTC